MLTDKDKSSAGIAMLRGDSFTRGNVTMFPLDGDYCVIKMDGAVTSGTRIITRN